MPMITFACNNPECTNCVDKFFRPSKKNEIPAFLDCGECGIGKMERVLGKPSSVSKFTIDNGLQAKEVEVINDIWTMNHEIANKKDDL